MNPVTDKRCDGCTYWDAKSDPYTLVLAMGFCNKAVAFWDATAWKADPYDYETGRVILPEYKDQMLFAQDGSDYRATVITRADFYCAHHIPPPKTLKEWLDAHPNKPIPLELFGLVAGQ